MTVTERKWFKRSCSLLKKPAKHLTEDEKNLVATMLEKSDAIRTAYILKEGFYTYVLSQQNKTSTMTALRQWIDDAETSRQKEGATAYAPTETGLMRLSTALTTHGIMAT